MDNVALAMDSNTRADKKLGGFFEVCYASLEELLFFVERHFTKYFDQDAKAPEGYIDLARKDVKANIRKLQLYISKAFSHLRLSYDKIFKEIDQIIPIPVTPET